VAPERGTVTPLSDVEVGTFARLRFVLTDIDDTLTRDGYLEEEAYSAMWKLARAGVTVIPVTGRPAGWCDCIARQWPVGGVVGENGAFAFYQEDGILKHLYHPETEALSDDDRAARLNALADQVLSDVPGTRVAKDQFSRKFDVAIDFREEEPKLDFATADRIKLFCERGGAHAKVSSIHVNAWFGEYDKLSMTRHFLEEIYHVDIVGDEVLFCGDSPNDEPMFAALRHSVAVANILPFVESLTHRPRYVCERPQGQGFSDLVGAILRDRELS
jgi:hypothetical protein